MGSQEGNLDAAEASYFAELQTNLSKKSVPLPDGISRICAADAAYDRDKVVAVACLFDGGKLAETSAYAGTCTFPYVSGLFYLREGPFAVQAVKGLRTRPQLLCFDAHGAAHPRSAGLATVGGMVVGVPSVGCAKSLLVGSVVSSGKGLDRVVYGGRTVGFVTRSGGAVRYWSAGYSVSRRRLESLVKRHATVCLRAMAEADRLARAMVRDG